ncbi:MAG TPA: hypothetical protein VIN07_10090 [Flavipsychrobacter sp.]
MIDLNNEHLKQEQASWLRTLERLRLENLLLKNKLIEIVKKDISKEQLEKAEFFQALFLDKDTVIALLRRDIARQASKPVPIHPEKNGYLQDQDKLKEDVYRMEKEFSAVKDEFNRFVMSI